MTISIQLIIGIIIGILLLWIAWFAILNLNAPAQNQKLIEFAKCLTSKGAKMYGAFWCDNCKNQKAMFGDAFQYINYTDCEPGNKPAQICIDANISGFPTWMINGKQYGGTQSLEKLASASGCELKTEG